MGRGLSAILPRGHAGGDGLREVPVELVGPNPHQPRRSCERSFSPMFARAVRNMDTPPEPNLPPYRRMSFSGITCGGFRISSMISRSSPNVPA